MKSINAIANNKQFSRGTIFRLYNVGLNPAVVSESDNFYDYMLVDILWEREKMLLVNVTTGKGRNKIGACYTGMVPKDIGGEVNDYIPYVSKKGLEFAFGEDMDNLYVLDDGEWEIRSSSGPTDN